MNARALFVAIAAAAILASGCKTTGNSSVGDTEPQTPASEAEKRTEAAQARIAGALYAALVPRLMPCWSRVRGKGEIAFLYTYARTDRDWTWEKQEVAESSLEKAQEAVAAECMLEAARGSSISPDPLDRADGAEGEHRLEIHWAWPVPMPKDTTQLARMIHSTDQGCLKICYACLPNNEGVSVCVASCSGFKGCSQDGTGTGCKMTRPECVTGWSGARAGLFIAREAPDTSTCTEGPTQQRSPVSLAK